MQPHELWNGLADISIKEIEKQLKSARKNVQKLVNERFGDYSEKFKADNAKMNLLVMAHLTEDVWRLLLAAKRMQSLSGGGTG